VGKISAELIGWMLTRLGLFGSLKHECCTRNVDGKH
jgi:hypothetical protein